MSPLVASLLASIIISLISSVGFLLYFLPQRFTRRLIPVLVSFAVGSLLGDAFLHIIPESSTSPIFILAGIIFFYLFERLIHLHHCHDPECRDHSNSLVSISLIGDTLHNFVDGLTIASAFLVNFPLGVATAIAVISHEIPQEIGDITLFLHSGLKLSKAFVYNLLSAFFSLVGVLVVFIVPGSVNISSYILPFAAGNFIYLALSDLVPVLHQQSSRPVSLLSQSLPLVLGVSFMYLLTLLG